MRVLLAVGDPPAPVDNEIAHDRFGAPLGFRPGTENDYGIHCMTLLGEIVRRVSGSAYEDFVTERILRPIGMHDSSYAAQPHMLDRLVIRGEDQPFGNDDFLVNFETVRDVPSAAGGLLSTAFDMAVFAQLFLNRGHYAGQRVLSGVSVDEMTRNQIPGIPCVGWGNRRVEEASWGLGWMIQGQERWPFWTGSLQPIGTVYHQGIGNSMMWFDKASDVIGVLLCAVNDFDFDTFRASWDVDLFQNMVSTSLVV